MKLRSYAPIALIFLLGFVTLVWFKGDFVLNNADLCYPVTPIKDFHQSLYGWWDRGVGQGNLRALAWSVIYNGIIAILSSIGFSISSGQKIIMYILFVASGISMYIFMHKFALKNTKYSRPSSFVSSVFYMMNLYNLQFLWGVIFLPSLFTYSFLPLILYTLDKSFRNKKYLCVLALLFFLISPTGNNPSYYLPLALGFGFFFFWYLFFSPKSERKPPTFIISHFLKILAIFFLVNSFWLIPIIFNLTKEYSQILSTEPFAFSSFAEMFRLLGWWSFNGSHKGYLYFPYSYVYDTPFFILIGFAIAIISLAILLKKKPLHLSIFFALTAIISLFFEKGTREPFSLINKWFYDNVPGFMAFHNPYKFGSFFAFSMAGLLGVSLTSIAKYLDKKRNPSFGFLFFLGSFLIINIYAWPFWTGDIYPEYKNSILKSSRIKIPQYYQDILAYTSSERENFKILGLPVLETVPSGWTPFKWGLYGEDPLYHFLDKSYILPTPHDNKYLIQQLFASLYKENNINLIQQISGFLNLKYVIWRNDVDCDFLSANTFCQNLENSIYHSSALNFKSSFGQLDIYEINKDFLPHFYIPQNTIYSPNDIEVLTDILSFDDYEIRSAIYLQEEQKLGNSLASLAEIEKLENKEKEKLENRADEIFVKGENKKDIEKILNQVQDDGKGEIFYPYVKHEPESLKWEAALLKEKYDKWQARKEPEKLLEKNLFYASKRINELKEFYADNTDIGADKTEKKQITELYREEMTAALDILENLKLEANEEFVKFWTKYNGTLAGHREKLEELGLVTKESDWEKVFEELERRTEELRVKQDFSKLVYEVDIPKNGNYRLYIKEINGLTDYSLLEERYFEKGKQELVLPIKEISENLLDKNLKIKSYLPNSFYKISLDYRTPTPVSLSVEEGDSREINKINLPPTGDKFESLEFFLKSSPEESNATLKFIGFEGEKPEIKYRNLQVQQIKQPILFLRSKDADNADSKNADNADKKDADEKTWIPKITFVKINPTKYRIKVEGAKEPYTLVFSESFHEGWRIYLKEEQKLGNSLASLAEIKKLGNWGAEKLGEAARGITDLFFDNKGYGEEVASYFDGQIKEGTHRNTFLEPATFETWGKEPIAQDNHLLVNGYANSWYITPNDVDGAENYELIVEFWPQRLFYIGLFISGLTLVGCLGYLGYETIKKRN